ncbi:Poly(U)-binding-splicing factor puf60 [Quaeritorhiza haematococci]|nr:Poly(U)-binding-splicing factor puf60 [Quaeritorhiza haematococci]
MNLFELGGLPLRVCKAMFGGPLPEGMKALDKLPAGPMGVGLAIPATVLNVAKGINSSIAQKAAASGHPLPSPSSSLIGGGATPGATAVGAGAGPTSMMTALQSAVAKVQEKVAEESVSLEENVSISANQRYAIMQKLLRKGEEGAQAAQPAAESTPTQQTTPVLNLKNMVTPEEIDEELHEEVAEECQKYGRVVKVIISTEGLSGNETADVFVCFEDSEGARRAQTALDGRFFGGRRIQALPYELEKFRELETKRG